MKKIIINLFMIFCYSFYGVSSVFAQYYIEYSDYISYEDVQELYIYPIVERNPITHHYYFDDYYYITNDKSIITDFLNELFPIAVAEEESEKQLKYSIFIVDSESSNELDVAISSGIMYKKDNKMYFPELYIADTATYDRICEKYTSLMEIKQMDTTTIIGYTTDPVPSNPILACSDWAVDYISDAYYKGIITHMDIFTESANREYFCEILYNFLNNLGYTSGISGMSDFEDINSEKIDVLVSMGLINGRSSKQFDPDDSITREEIAVIINRIIEYVNIDSESTNFIYEDDGNISEWAKDSVYKLVGSGIMEGDGVCFNPQRNSTKEQAVATLMRLYYIITDNN